MLLHLAEPLDMDVCHKSENHTKQNNDNNENKSKKLNELTCNQSLLKKGKNSSNL